MRQKLFKVVQLYCAWLAKVGCTARSSKTTTMCLVCRTPSKTLICLLQTHNTHLHLQSLACNVHGACASLPHLGLEGHNCGSNMRVSSCCNLDSNTANSHKGQIQQIKTSWVCGLWPQEKGGGARRCHAAPGGGRGPASRGAANGPKSRYLGG